MDVKPVAWLREQRGDCEGKETLDPFFVLGAKRPQNFENGATYEPLFDKAALDAAVAAERERCANVCVDVAAEAVKKYQDSTAPVPQPYANNRLMHVGWSAADAIRKG